MSESPLCLLAREACCECDSSQLSIISAVVASEDTAPLAQGSRAVAYLIVVHLVVGGACVSAGRSGIPAGRDGLIWLPCSPLPPRQCSSLPRMGCSLGLLFSSLLRSAREPNDSPLCWLLRADAGKSYCLTERFFLALATGPSHLTHLWLWSTFSHIAGVLSSCCLQRES